MMEKDATTQTPAPSRTYIVFDNPSEFLRNNPEIYYNPNNETLTEQEKEQITKAFEEISSTPEGQKLIKSTFLNEHKHINIVNSPNGYINAIAPNTITMGTYHKSLRYTDENGNDQDMSLQRLLIHEMNHLNLKHTNTAENEKEAINNTNRYMKKYYNEPTRNAHDEFDKKGTDKWDFNENFKPQIKEPAVQAATLEQTFSQP